MDLVKINETASARKETSPRNDRKKTTAKPTKMKRKWKIMDAIKWKTVSVIPLSSGWSNRYRRKDGRMIVDPCPGLVIQERGGESRVCFATYFEGLVFPAIETAGYEDSSTAGGPRSNPYRAGLPPWLLLDEQDPADKVAADIANARYLATSFVQKSPENTP